MLVLMRSVSSACRDEPVACDACLSGAASVVIAWTASQRCCTALGAGTTSMPFCAGVLTLLIRGCSSQERVVQVSRVTKVVKGGKSMSFR